MAFDLPLYLKIHQELVNQHLKTVFQQFEQEERLIAAMNHCLMAGGKRVRPILTIAAAQLCQDDFMPALPACCAIEMIHTYSLIHDDLPAMDDDDLRRGLPTCHKQFDEATAILAGDALLTHAFHIMSAPQACFNRFPDGETRLQLVSKIAQAAGISGMVQGQMMDMQSLDVAKENALSYLERMHALKTGKMITLSVEAGALSVGAKTHMIHQLMIYADKIGLAFQVADDILNIEGNPEKMGKAAGSDMLNDKMTFPSLMGLEASKTYAKNLVKEALEAIDEYDQTAAPLRAIAQYIIERDR